MSAGHARCAATTAVVCRGAKPVAALKRHQVQMRISSAKPQTTRELLEALAPVDLEGGPSRWCTTASGTPC